MKTAYLFAILLTISMLAGTILLREHNDRSPKKMIRDLGDAIKFAEDKGDYNCCIEPTCTMCYLGHWKFDEGTCHCDRAIADERYDDVCPECESGIEKGVCKSTKTDCSLNEEGKNK